MHPSPLTPQGRNGHLAAHSTWQSLAPSCAPSLPCHQGLRQWQRAFFLHVSGGGRERQPCGYTFLPSSYGAWRMIFSLKVTLKSLQYP